MSESQDQGPVLLENLAQLKFYLPLDFLSGYVHYPSIRHFIDMANDEEYQKVNKKHRLGVSVFELPGLRFRPFYQI